jgi:tetratricopeptide (TPR) repeat protein
VADLQELRARGISCMRSGDNEACYLAFTEAIRLSPSDAYLWYGAGYAARQLKLYGEASKLLERSAELDPSEPATFLALGIAQQLNEEFDVAIQSFAAAIKLDEDFAAAYNSLALTQKRQGRFEEAIHNYDAGTKALTRRFVRRLINTRESRIFKWREMSGSNWHSCAMFGAFYHAAVVIPTGSVSFPTGQQALNEEVAEAHDGLMWIDIVQSKGASRHFLPNYFNTFREFLLTERVYAILVGNRGLVMQILGRHEEAELLLAEADEFSSGDW